MTFETGDAVVHCTFGLGEVVGIEEKVLAGEKDTYYAVMIGDMTVWVPTDEQAQARLRPPTSKRKFKNLLKTLGRKSENLPQETRERKEFLDDMAKDGETASLVRTLRALATHEHVGNNLNDHEQKLLKRCREALLAEWSHVLEVTVYEAEDELARRLGEMDK